MEEETTEAGIIGNVGSQSGPRQLVHICNSIFFFIVCISAVSIMKTGSLISM